MRSLALSRAVTAAPRVAVTTARSFSGAAAPGDAPMSFTLSAEQKEFQVRASAAAAGLLVARRERDRSAF